MRVDGNIRSDSTFGGKSVGGSTDGWSATYYNGNYGCRLWDQGSTYNAEEALTLGAENIWRYVVCVLDEDTAHTLYRDGVQVAQVTGVGAIGAVANSRPLTFNGRDWQAVSARGITGAYDEWRFAKVARSPAWVQAQYEVQQGQSGSFILYQPSEAQ